MLQFDEETARLLEIAYQGADVTPRRRMAFDALHLAAGDVVIDIGCGNGLLTQELARAVGPSGRVVGVDPSADMRVPALERCADHAAVTIEDGLADAQPVEDGEADKAIAVQVLEYLDDIPAAMREAHRVLRPSGRLVAIDAGFGTLDWFSEDQNRMQHVQAAWDKHYLEAYVAALWSTLCKDAGFTEVEIEPFTFCDTTLKPDGIAFMLLHLMSRYAANNNHVPQDEAQAWFDE